MNYGSGSLLFEFQKADNSNTEVKEAFIASLLDNYPDSLIRLFSEVKPYVDNSIEFSLETLGVAYEDEVGELIAFWEKCKRALFVRQQKDQELFENDLISRMGIDSDPYRLEGILNEVEHYFKTPTSSFIDIDSSELVLARINEDSIIIQSQRLQHIVSDLNLKIESSKSKEVTEDKRNKEVDGLTELDNGSTQKVKLEWIGSKTDLFQVIYALWLSKRIQGQDGNEISLNQLAMAFNDLFDIEITGQIINKEMSRLIDRNKIRFDNKFVTQELQDTFINALQALLVENKDAKLKERK